MMREADLGGKLKIVCDKAPIHSPKSRALARDTPQDDACFHLHLHRDIPHSQDDDLVHWPNLTANLLNFIRNKQPDVLHIFPLLPSSRKNVPLEKPLEKFPRWQESLAYLNGSANDDITLFKKAEICAHLTSEGYDLLTSLKLSKLLPPFCHTLLNHL